MGLRKREIFWHRFSTGQPQVFTAFADPFVWQPERDRPLQELPRHASLVWVWGG